MKTYIIYNTITGQPIQISIAESINMIQHILVDNIGAIEVEVEPTTENYYINTSGEVVEISAQPSSEHTWNWTTKQWENLVTEEMRQAKAAQHILAKRKQLLQDTDWLVIRAMDTGTQIAANWQTYRQALRDITQQPGYPFTVNWPQPPSQ
jgi:hypothetical protein